MKAMQTSKELSLEAIDRPSDIDQIGAECLGCERVDGLGNERIDRLLQPRRDLWHCARFHTQKHGNTRSPPHGQFAEPNYGQSEPTTPNVPAIHGSNTTDHPTAPATPPSTHRRVKPPERRHTYRHRTTQEEVVHVRKDERPCRRDSDARELRRDRPAPRIARRDRADRPPHPRHGTADGGHQRSRPSDGIAADRG